MQYDGGVGFSRKQFKQLKSRLQGRKSDPSGRLASSSTDRLPSGMTSGRMVVLGIDPSLRGTGFGLIESSKDQRRVLQRGIIRCPTDWAASACLVRITETLRQLVRQYSPDVCAIEGLFYAQNLKTALIMGQARGAAMASVAEAGLEIFEIAPRKVKQAIVGYGAAQKYAVARMVQRMLKLESLPKEDEADALAIALTYIHENRRSGLAHPKKT